MINILNTKEKHKIVERLNEQFGISELPFMLIQAGKERLRGFFGSLSPNELKRLSENVRVEVVGSYLMTEESDGFRFSFDSLFVFKDKIKKNLVEISDDNAEKWLAGQDIDVEHENAWVVLKNKEDLIGCGKVKDGRVKSYVPKERRVR